MTSAACSCRRATTSRLSRRFQSDNASPRDRDIPPLQQAACLELKPAVCCDVCTPLVALVQAEPSCKLKPYPSTQLVDADFPHAA